MTTARNTSEPGAPRGVLAHLADLAYRRRGRMLIAWIAALAAVLVLAPRIAGKYNADYATPGSESEQAAKLVAQRFPGTSGDTIDVVWQAKAGVRDPRIQASMARFLSRAERIHDVGRATQPRTSPDGSIATASLDLTKQAWDVPTSTGRKLIDLAESTSGKGLRVELGGSPIQQAEGGGSPQGVGFLAAAIVLLIAFGSVVAAGLPLAVAAFGLGISASLIGVLAGVIDVPNWTPAVAGLIGIGVGIDYALLVLTRFRTALDLGRDPHEATVEAVATAGRSVLVAGSTVVVSLLGLFFVGVSYLRGVAISSSLAVLIVMAGAVTLLPALLGFARRRVNRLRIPGLGRAARLDDAAPAARWSRLIQRRPWSAAIAAVAVLLVLAAPALGLRLGFADEGNDPSGTTTRAAYELTARGFGPGANGPLLLAATTPGGARDAKVLRGLADEARKTPDVAFVSGPQPNRSGDAATLTVIPRSSPQAAATEHLVNHLRDEVIPGAVRGSDVNVYLGGETAAFIDQGDYVSGRLPVFIAGVVALSFLLLLVAFRAPLIALKAGVMNLLSIGAAYGVITLFAAGGWLGGLIGIDTQLPIAPFVPVMMFAILFGLSMDYEVFLLSRVREEYLGDRDTSRAVADGLARTARVISAAAAIMVVVFLAFVVSDQSFLKLIGIGMASAILVDATIVRLVLVPAIMQLLGRANWWIPAWLDRILPRLDPGPATSGAER